MGNKESSIMSSDLQPTSSWREDFKPLLHRSNSLNPSITPESGLDKDTYALASRWSTSHPSWLQKHLSHTSHLPHPQSSSLVKLVDKRERRRREREPVMTDEAFARHPNSY